MGFLETASELYFSGYSALRGVGLGRASTTILASSGVVQSKIKLPLFATVFGLNKPRLHCSEQMYKIRRQSKE